MEPPWDWMQYGLQLFRIIIWYWHEAVQVIGCTMGKELAVVGQHLLLLCLYWRPYGSQVGF